jgi:hypothetical protein
MIEREASCFPARVAAIRLFRLRRVMQDPTLDRLWPHNSTAGRQLPPKAQYGFSLKC